MLPGDSLCAAVNDRKLRRIPLLPSRDLALLRTRLTSRASLASDAAEAGPFGPPLFWLWGWAPVAAINRKHALRSARVALPRTCFIQSNIDFFNRPVTRLPAPRLSTEPS